MLGSVAVSYTIIVAVAAQAGMLSGPTGQLWMFSLFERAREVSRGMRVKWRVAVLALGVDHFERIADEFGPLTGDEAIKEIGELIRETARAGDVVARLGGKEFRILAPDTDEALYVAKRNGRDQDVLWQTGMRAFDMGSSRLSREIERMP